MIKIKIGAHRGGICNLSTKLSDSLGLRSHEFGGTTIGKVHSERREREGPLL